MRGDREDLATQREALADARQNLKDELLELSKIAKAAARSPGRLDEVGVAWRLVLKAEEALDFATMDLQGARGEDL